MMNKASKQQPAGWLIAVLFLINAACSNQPRNGTATEINTDDAERIDSSHVDTVVAKFTDQPIIRVVAGNSIGDFLIEQEMEESNLFNRLGEVDSADAAMCKSWSIWYLENKNAPIHPAPEFDVYSACDADIDMKKSIQVMRLSEVDFEMDNGISFGANVSVLKESYPEAVELSFTDAVSDTIVKVYDDVAAGIAFELRNEEIRAVIVHVPNQGIENMYLPFYKQ